MPKKHNDPGQLVIPWNEYCRIKDDSRVRSKDEEYTMIVSVPFRGVCVCVFWLARYSLHILAAAIALSVPRCVVPLPVLALTTLLAVAFVSSQLQAEATNDTKAEASRTRRREFEVLDQTRLAESQETELDRETKKREQSLLANARNQLAEQDDEIKKLNELILEAKVKTVRDKQLWEKTSIRKTQQEHEYQVDMMMEEERVRKVLEAEQKGLARREQLMRGREDIEEQIGEKELRSTLNLEIKTQEQKAMLEKLQLLHLEDFENAQQKRAEARALMDDVARANQMAIEIRRGKEEAEKFEAMNMAQYLEEKARQEQQLEEDGLRKKALWERKQAAMIEQQDNQKNVEVRQQDLIVKRALDAVERKARTEEREKAITAAYARQDLLEGLDDQLRQRNVELNAASSKERAEFEENAAALQEVTDIEKLRAADLKSLAYENKKGVIQQIKTKERKAVKERKDFFEEGGAIQRQAEDRRRRLEDIKEQKLAQLAATGMDQDAIDQVTTAIGTFNRRQNQVAA